MQLKPVHQYLICHVGSNSCVKITGCVIWSCAKFNHNCNYNFLSYACSFFWLIDHLLINGARKFIVFLHRRCRLCGIFFSNLVIQKIWPICSKHHQNESKLHQEKTKKSPTFVQKTTKFVRKYYKKSLHRWLKTKRQKDAATLTEIQLGLQKYLKIKQSVLRPLKSVPMESL